MPHAVDLINHTAVRRLNWRTPYEILYGDTPDISVFWFIFYEPVYYLEPNIQFPKANMLPGRFLGIARTTGDAFTFVITMDDGIKSIALHRSVIRRRDIKSRDPYADYNTEDMAVEETDGDNDQIEGSQNNLSGDISDHEGNSISQQGSFDEVIISDIRPHHPAHGKYMTILMQN
jgi:hypothetical protein